MQRAYTIKDIGEAIRQGQKDVLHKLNREIDFLWGLEKLEENIEENNGMATNICNIARHLRYTFKEVKNKIERESE